MKKAAIVNKFVEVLSSVKKTNFSGAGHEDCYLKAKIHGEKKELKNIRLSERTSSYSILPLIFPPLEALKG